MSAWPDALRSAEEAGGAAARAYRQNPDSVADSDLGAFSDGVSPLSAAAIRLLLSFGLSPRVVAVPALLMFGRRRREKAVRVLGKYAYWWGVRGELGDRDLLGRLTRGAVVLMYHAVGRDGEPPSTYVVPVRRFRRQVAWLGWCGRPVITFGELVAHLRAHRPPPAGAVVITFDDGYADNHDVALPVLTKYGFRATVFMVSGGVGGSVSWASDGALRHRALLTAEQATELHAAGFEIGAHSRTHPSLPSVAPDDRRQEIAGCRDDLERLLAAPVRTFAYPFGDYDPDVKRIVQEAGYDGACCSRSGINEPGAPLYELRRVEVRGSDSWWSFVRMVWTGRRPSHRGGRRAVPGAVVRRP